ncbi:MHYT domain-containing protein [Paraglaciecola sp.]|uniref:MHYT domain-containing protein n=1 Tax=Paraglaciecola sp. TaxID=1920173 RepID=UPI003EF1E94B
MSYSFDWLIVFLSIIIAIYVSYIVVGICIRIAASKHRTALYWTIGGALSMATGIWAMHFVGMLAFTLPVPVHYDIALTGLSILPAIFASAIALYMIRSKRKKTKFIISAALMGLGISAMHYIGMAAMGMGSCIEYSTGLVFLSILIAIVASNVALFLLFHQIDNNRLDHGFKLLSALIMGVAIAGMHYVGMLAASFPKNCVSTPVFGISLERDILVIIVTMASIFILTITQMLTVIDRKISEKSFFEAVFKAQSAVGRGILVLENEKIVLINDVLRTLFSIEKKDTKTISQLAQTFASHEFERFSHWVNKSKNHKSPKGNAEFQLGENQAGRILSATQVKFIHIDRVRLLIVIDDITDKKNVEQSLNQLNESLEQRVDERTNELTQANNRLNESFEALHEAQNELVQSQKMASLGSLVAGISHEINTPIGIGVTSASSIEEEVRILLPKYHNGEMTRSDLENFLNHTKEGSAILTQNLHRASELISSFKQVAVDQTGDIYREIRLHDYINEVITSMRPKFKKTSISVNNETQEDIVINTKPGALFQIVSNFIDNSLTHGFNQDSVGSILISSESDDNNLTLVVEDTGKGIDESIKARIFDPFFTTRRGTGGSGLGLNIVYNLITSTLRGKVKVISSPGNGARFEVKLPINDGELNDDK